MTITHSTASSASMMLVPSSQALPIPQGTQVGLDECQCMSWIVLQKRNTELEEFTIFIVRGMQGATSALPIVSCKHNVQKRPRSVVGTSSSWHPWQECAGRDAQGPG